MAVYAFSDLHGQYDLWRQIKEFCKPDDKLYFLGDAADRGSDGVRIMVELLADPRIIYLKGNHEYFIENFFFNNANEEALKIWTINGGGPTQKALIDLINSGGNPEIMVMNMLQQRAGNNKLFANLLQLAQAQDTQQIESIVKNIVNESGKNYEEEFNSFRNTLGL